MSAARRAELRVFAWLAAIPPAVIALADLIGVCPQ